MPMNTLKFHIGIILLEVEIQCFIEVDVWPLDSEVILPSQVELGELEILWEYLHLYYYIII